jgi:hypothetical protein
MILVESATTCTDKAVNHLHKLGGTPTQHAPDQNIIILDRLICLLLLIQSRSIGTVQSCS